jgi:hypothetical protein
MIDTKHWRFQQILQEAAAYRVLRDAIADRSEAIQTERPSSRAIIANKEFDNV